MSHTRTCPQCGRTYTDDDRFCTVDGAALVSAGSASLLGTVVADRFLVIQKLGEGGMGEVYLAEHVRMKRKVALKLMRPWMIGDPVAVGRFHREAENASQISHPNVAQVYDFGETTGGIVYLAMEFVDGEPLSAILAREGRLHAVRTAEIVRQTAEALYAAHAMGILHRDLKPDNVMVARSRAGTDVVKLVDFGIARAMHRGTQQFTSTGMMVGTPDYMSPEQLSGDELDIRSDLYALALMAFRMLTGTGAYPEGSSGESMVARLTSAPRPLATVFPEVPWPEPLQAAFNRALAPDPKDRFADTMEFVAELDAAVSEMPLGNEEQSYLVALSQRNPTPVRGGSAVPTPTRGTGAVRTETPMPMAAVLTPPERPHIDTRSLQAPIVPPITEPSATTEALPAAAESVAPASFAAAVPEAVAPAAVAPPPDLVPRRANRMIPLGIAAAIVVGAAGFLLTRGGGEAPRPPAVAPPVTEPRVDLQTAQASPALPPPAPVEAAPADSASAPDAGADSALMAKVRRATLALWSSAGRGAAVITDSTGLALTSASLVPLDSAVEVFLDPNTRVRATVLSIDRSSGLATLLLPMRRCARCAVLVPDAADPAVGDSVFILPGANRGDGEEGRAAIVTFDGRTITTSSQPRNAAGAPVVSRRTQRLVALGGRRLATPTALRDAVASGRARARGVTPSEVVVPIWPDRSVPGSALNDEAIARAKSEIARYRVSQGGLTALLMTPQVMKYRADLNANPLVIPADPIRAWSPFPEYVRRAVVAVNVSLSEAAFPTWPQKDVNFKRGDVRAVRLFRNDTLVTPIETGTFPALTSNGKQAILSSAIAVYSALEFRTGDRFRLEVTDARGGSDVSIALPPGAIEVIRSDFAWLLSR